MILIVTDAHAKWINANVTQRATSHETIERLRQCFATHGLPRLIVTDNRTCFTSSEFTHLNGIIHKFVSPHHQASNGLSKSSVSFVKSGLNKIHGGSLQTRLSRLLFAHCITPHTTTGVTPAELLMKRRLRTRLDCLRPDVASVVHQNQWKQRLGHDKHAVQHCTALYCVYINIRDPVFVKNFGHGKAWLPGRVHKNEGPLSHKINLEDSRVVRRHLDHVQYRSCDPVIFTNDVSPLPEPVMSDVVDADGTAPLPEADPNNAVAASPAGPSAGFVP